MIGKSVSLPSDALPYRRLLISPVQISAILGDPGADSGGEGKSKRADKNKARRKVKNSEKSSSGRSLLFFCAIFFRLFRLSSPPLSARGNTAAKRNAHEHKI